MTDTLRKESAERRKAEEDQANLQAAVQQSAKEWLHTFDACNFPFSYWISPAISFNRTGRRVSCRGFLPRRCAVAPQESWHGEVQNISRR